MESITISFDGQGLRLDTRDDAEQICRELQGKEVRVLILQGNTFGIEAAKRVGEELAKQKFLREAHFKDIFTSRGRHEVPVAIDHLLTGISQSGTELTLLDLSDNAIGPIGAPAVEKFLKTKAASKIEKLYINNCGMGPEGGSFISVPISELRLKEFVCGRNRLENKGAKFMFAALSEMKTLEILRMPQNGINVKGITFIVQALMENINTIRVIDLSDNTIKLKGADALDKVIVGAKNLKELKLDDALLGNEGFSVICDAISRSESLGTLEYTSFEGNEISGKKIVDLIELTFKGVKTGFELNLLENEFTRDELERLQSMADPDRVNIIIDDPEDFDYADEDEEDEDNDDNSDDNDEKETNSNKEINLSNGDNSSLNNTGIEERNSALVNSFGSFGI